MIYGNYRISSPDVIYTHQIEAGKLGLMLRLVLHRPYVYDAHSSIALEAPTFKDVPSPIRRRIFFYERMIIKFAAKVIVPSEELKSFLIHKYRLNPDRIGIVKNGVDRERFFPCSTDFGLRKRIGLDEDTFLVVFTNPRLPTFPSNEIALKNLFDIVPNLEKRLPGIKFLILGGGSRPKPPTKNVIYTGYVDDLPPYINIANVCVAPFPGNAVCGGTRTKVCEYFACGKPVVSTEEGIRGFDDAIPGKHFFLAKNQREFVERIVECYQFPGRAKEMGRRARIFSHAYGWKHLSQELEKNLAEVVSL